VTFCVSHFVTTCPLAQQQVPVTRLRAAAAEAAEAPRQRRSRIACRGCCKVASLRNLAAPGACLLTQR
jgi:hypothetical protein